MSRDLLLQQLAYHDHIRRRHDEVHKVWTFTGHRARANIMGETGVLQVVEDALSGQTFAVKNRLRY